MQRMGNEDKNMYFLSNDSILFLQKKKTALQIMLQIEFPTNALLLYTYIL